MPCRSKSIFCRRRSLNSKGQRVSCLKLNILVTRKDINVNYEVIVTCAVTGAGDTVGKHPAVPVTPKQIADAAVEAAKAGAAIAHMHVRDPKTGKGSRESALYREVVERVRDSGTDVIINLTAGMGGDLEV